MDKTSAELILANEKLLAQYKAKEKLTNKLISANKELAFQNSEREKRAAELAFQNNEKEKRASELLIANQEHLPFRIMRRRSVLLNYLLRIRN